MTVDRLVSVVRVVSAVDINDGLVLKPDTARARPIRDTADYPGLRLRVDASIHTWQRPITWDVSTGDPIVPAPRLVRIPRLLGEDLQILGYAPETVVAEKSVTILERGTTSTRWRDYVDIVLLCERCDLDSAVLTASIRAVAETRKVRLQPISTAVEGYGAVGQERWLAWLRLTELEGVAHRDLDEQMRAVTTVVDPFLQAAAAGQAGPRL